jgi:L-alanine-DL-glutamate epimerase-like enolase superfamily enzyme
MLTASARANTPADLLFYNNDRLYNIFCPELIPLDKSGGLTEILALLAEAEHLGFAIIEGRKVASWLAMAPTLLPAGNARFIDLDGRLLIRRDRPDGLVYGGSIIYPPAPALWR